MNQNSKLFVEAKIPIRRVFELNGSKYLGKNFDNVNNEISNIEYFEATNLERRVESDDGNEDEHQQLKPFNQMQLNEDIDRIDEMKYGMEKQNPMYKSDAESEDEDANDSGIPIHREFYDEESCTYHDPASKFLATNQYNSKLKQQADDYDVINDSNYHYLNPNTILNVSHESKSSPIENKMKQLKKDMFEEFLTVQVNLNELFENIAIVHVFDRLWIAGINLTSSTTPNLGTALQIGDLIDSINDTKINTLNDLNTLIEFLNTKLLHIQIKRLPFARIIFIPKYQIDDASLNLIKQKKYNKYVKKILGVKLDSNKKPSRIVKIDQNGIFYRTGLKYNPNRVEYDIKDMSVNSSSNNMNKKEAKIRLTTWSLTECNEIPISLIMSNDKIYEILCNVKGDDSYIVVQPTDLIKMLLKELKKRYNNWKNYII